MTSRIAALAPLLGVIGVVAASADASRVYSFSNITGNSALNAAAGEAQLRVEVSSYSGTLDLIGGSSAASFQGVAFRFYHEGTSGMVLTDIFFENSVLSSLDAIADDDDNTSNWTNSSGSDRVDYSRGVNGTLPGGNNIGFSVNALHGLDPDPAGGVKHNGVAPGEEVTAYWSLQSGMDIDDVFSALDGGSLRIGIHVQSFASDGGSEAFVNTVSLVPLPSAAGMGLVGLAVCAGVRRRR